MTNWMRTVDRACMHAHRGRLKGKIESVRPSTDTQAGGRGAELCTRRQAHGAMHGGLLEERRARVRGGQVGATSKHKLTPPPLSNHE